MERQPTEERKQQIAQAALKIIAERGLGKFTTSAIAKEVGFSDGAIFRHFKSKKDIVLAAIDAVEALFFKNFPPRAADPIERLGAFIRQRLDTLLKHPLLVRLIFSSQLAQASGNEGRKRIGGMQARTIDFIHSCLKEAEEKQMLREGLGADDLTIIVFGSVFGAANRDHYAAILANPTENDVPDRIWKTLETLIRR